VRFELACVVLLAASGFAAAEEKPSCNKSRVGQFWPAEANDSPLKATQFARSGDLEVCALKGWHYRWTQPSVSIEQLRGEKKHGPAAPPTEGEADRSKTAP